MYKVLRKAESMCGDCQGGLLDNGGLDLNFEKWLVRSRLPERGGWIVFPSTGKKKPSVKDCKELT